MSNKCILMGLTGEIGSGKSTVLSLFAELGICILSADQIARQLTQAGQPALQQIVNKVGAQILTADGALDRGQLREMITQNAELREWLEGLLHPLIRQEIQNQITQCKGPYAIVEIPLLLKREDYPYLDRILLVEAPKAYEITRLMQRDKASREQVLAMLAIQPKPDVRRALSDDILMNDGSVSDLRSKVALLHQKYILLQ